MSSSNTIILSAGKIDYTRLPVGSHQSNATIPVNGKPVISWILDDLIRKGIESVQVVIRPENKKLYEILDKHYHKRIQLTIVKVENAQSIIDSLSAGLEGAGDDGGTRIILGDTLIYDSYANTDDFVYVAPVDATENWCIAQLDGESKITGFIDKQTLKGEGFSALCGYYSFSNTPLLKQSVQQSKQQGLRELSSVLAAYNAVQPLQAVKAENWFDFGHMETFIASKKSLLRPRHFNQLVIHPLYNTITKVSQNNDKLFDELNWYLLLPEELQALTPRILKKEAGGGKISITQEFYGYPSLSELYVYGDLSLSVWKSIINYLLEIHKLFLTYTQPAAAEDCREIYLTKTLKRIEVLKEQNPYWQKVWGYDTITVNGKKLHNYAYLLEKFAGKIDVLCNSGKFTILHGDYCLSNILYDVPSQIVRLIDPRGSFGRKGIYGDPRYDIAKLRHSISGCYDYIVGDLFYVEDKGDTFTFSVFNNENNAALAEHLDGLITANNYSLEEIKLIEGLLFLSMLPYHADYFERQKMMYLQGLLILNELCE